MTRFCWCDTDCCEGSLDLPCPARDRWLEIDDSEMED